MQEFIQSCSLTSSDFWQTFLAYCNLKLNIRSTAKFRRGHAVQMTGYTIKASKNFNVVKINRHF